MPLKQLRKIDSIQALVTITAGLGRDFRKCKYNYCIGHLIRIVQYVVIIILLTIVTTLIIITHHYHFVICGFYRCCFVVSAHVVCFTSFRVLF